MKRLSLLFILPLTAVALSILVGTRGDKDLLKQDLPAPSAQKTPELPNNNESSDKSRAESLSVPGPSAQQAGQVDTSSRVVRSGQETEAPNDEHNGGEFKYGTEPGQVSNVPGETANGVHGTVNSLGFGGKPIRIPKAP